MVLAGLSVRQVDIDRAAPKPLSQLIAKLRQAHPRPRIPVEARSRT